MVRLKIILAVCIFSTSLLTSQTALAAEPVVLELFTSQSCSSCPPADALLKQLAASDPSIIALSYHVDYWDGLSWKDTYSSPAATQRQRDYAQARGTTQVFTPEMIVDGTHSMVGSDENAVNAALVQAKQMKMPLTIKLTPQDHKLAVSITVNNKAVSSIELLEVHYDRTATTQVQSGENGGRTLQSINNVTSITPIGSLQIGAAIPMLAMPEPGEGIAILAQSPNHGRILGAAIYNRP